MPKHPPTWLCLLALAPLAAACADEGIDPDAAVELTADELAAAEADEADRAAAAADFAATGGAIEAADAADLADAEAAALAGVDPGAASLTTEATCTVSGTNIQRSLVVTTPAILAKFPFSRVMDRLRSTAGVTAVQTNRGIFQTWMKTFGSTTAAGDCNDANIDPNDYGLACPRVESTLSTIDPFVASSNVSWQPVGLFNRVDLAPASGANCGEFRIVYAMSSTNPSITGRAFLIFEAVLPNPTPSAGKAACVPVARFWQGLTADADEASRAAKLEKFYFTGGAVTGFRPVVDARHYGLANGATAAFTAGQVRTNFFIRNIEWHLREFKLRKACTNTADPTTCRLRFDHVTVKANPAEELFAGTHARSADFRTAFSSTVSALRAGTINGIGMSIPDQFNEFESVSQFGAQKVNYDAVANSTVRSAIQSRLTALGSTLTPKNILDRATTQTCAGCHQASNGVALGGGLTWPSSRVFVHIDEGRNLSTALTSHFLPHRKTVLEQFINGSCTTAAAALAPVDTGLTIGGSHVGAAN